MPQTSSIGNKTIYTKPLHYRVQRLFHRNGEIKIDLFAILFVLLMKGDDSDE